MKVYGVAEPTRRLMLARDRRDLRNPNNPIRPYEVPFPFVRVIENSGNSFYAYDGKFYEMSPDGERWVPAELPHVYHGLNNGCMQDGRFRFDTEDILGNITNYVVAYAYPTFTRYWAELFGLASLDFFDQAARPVMEAWEACSIEQVLGYLDENVPATTGVK